MHIYEQLIESGFSDVIFINTLLGEVYQRHRGLGVTHDDITVNIIKSLSKDLIQ